MNQPVLQEILPIVRAAGELMLRRDGAASIQTKAAQDFVTEVDFRVQSFIRDRLKAGWPDIQFMGEERDNSDIDFSKPYWVLDPIDGTTNFMCGYDHSAVSVGLLLDGKPLFGGIFDPYRDEYYSAVTGKGATCNGKPITVSTRPITRGIVAIGSAPYRKDTLSETMFAMTADLFRTFADFRRSGSAALDICHVASGRVDAFCEPILSPWDYAAGSVILAEAGGIATNFAGNPLDLSAPSSCVFGSPISHPAALAVCGKHAAVTESII